MQVLGLSESLIDKVKLYDKSKFVKLIPKAINLIQEAHKDQKRDSGEPFFTHPLAVAEILSELKLDSVTIIAGLLHDIVEDTHITLENLQQEFAPEIADLVDGVTKLTQIEDKSDSVIQAENFRKLIVAVSKDIRVLLIKLADRMHNMRTLHHITSTTKRHKIALETMEVFAPLAERIGMHWFKNELQDLAFKELQPDARNSILTRLNQLKSRDLELEENIIFELEILFKTYHLDCVIIGRQKTAYSIWDKMKRKNINFEQLSDVMAFRLVVNSDLDCYKALGVIHTKYHTIPGTIKDFISTPKKNGYQSIHTVLIGPRDHKIEIQIRTHAMHEIAEIGIAAHWCYKQKHESIDITKYTWIKELLDILQSASDSNELLENTKLEMYDDQVFCFSPRGALIALPKGASTVDFAYAVHSDIGNKCVGAKINGKVAPLRTKLENGDQVEIITKDNHKPLPSWQNFVVTGKALSEIKRSVREDNRIEYINLGKVMLNQFLQEKSLQMPSKKLLKAFTKFFHKNSVEDFLCSIGEGNIARSSVLKYFSKVTKGDTIETKTLEQFNDSINNVKISNHYKIPIKGLVNGVAVHLANCCNPIPGDAIVGLHQTGKGITVHISDCETLQNYSLNPEQWIDLAWDKNRSGEGFRVCINAVILNKPGSLSIISAEIAKQEANITNFKITNRSEEFFDIAIDIDVKGLTHLSNILALLRTKPCVQSVHRYFR